VTFIPQTNYTDRAASAASEFSANFWAYKLSRGQLNGSLRPLISVFKTGSGNNIYPGMVDWGVTILGLLWRRKHPRWSEILLSGHEYTPEYCMKLIKLSWLHNCWGKNGNYNFAGMKETVVEMCERRDWNRAGNKNQQRNKNIGQKTIFLHMVDVFVLQC
jgi:hypothetical protein